MEFSFFLVVMRIKVHCELFETLRKAAALSAYYLLLSLVLPRGISIESNMTSFTSALPVRKCQ
jgi:hypothetical protein